MLNESVIKILKNSMWNFATCANGEPNVVPVAFKDVTAGEVVNGNPVLYVYYRQMKSCAIVRFTR